MRSVDSYGAQKRCQGVSSILDVTLSTCKICPSHQEDMKRTSRQKPKLGRTLKSTPCLTICGCSNNIPKPGLINIKSNWASLSERNSMRLGTFIESARLCLSLVACVLLLTRCSSFVFHGISVRSAVQRRYITTNRIQYPRFGSFPLILSAYPNEVSHLEPKQSGSSGPGLGKQVIDLYVGYCKRLWDETSPLARKNVAKNKTISAIEQVQSLVRDSTDAEHEYGDSNKEEHQEWLNAKEQILSACETMLLAMKKQQPQQRQQQNTLHNFAVPETTADSADLKTQQEINSTQHKVPVISISDLLSDTAISEQKHISLEKTSDGSTKVPSPSSSLIIKKKKPRRSILFGAAMGGVVACWVFSGNFIFTALFTLMTLLGQLEFYRMAMNAGIYPARRISVCGACAMFITALFAPNLHQVCLPLFATYAMIWFLTMRRTVSSLSEIATTFTGMFLFGYIPSFWVRIRLIGSEREPTRLAPLVTPMLALLGKTATSLPAWIPKAIHLPITTGAVFIFWTWLSIAFSDVGAYFSGRYFGKTKLSSISPAAGATSPNKTVEGLVGGIIISVMFALCGAWVQNWPYWWVTGTIHGTLLAILGFIGDLTASMLKRDAGLKDFGDLIPEHGGILDRVDSYIFTAPYSWLFLAYIIPSLKAFSRR